MIVNLIIIAFLLLMAFFWSTQGLFSALLHCLLVILCGALTLALWEPVAYLLLDTGTLAAHYAWGVSIIGLFVISLLLGRLGMDTLVPKNLQFPDLMNQAGGIAFGLISGWLTAGMALLGVSFLPLGQDIAGYQPYELEGRGAAGGVGTRAVVSAGQDNGELFFAPGGDIAGADV